MKLSEARTARRLSLVELAKRAGIAHTTIADIEAGRSTPRLSTIAKIEKALGISGNLISEFWPVLGEPKSRLYQQMTGQDLANSIQRARDSIEALEAGKAKLVSLDELQTRAKSRVPEHMAA